MSIPRNTFEYAREKKNTEETKATVRALKSTTHLTLDEIAL